MSHDQQVILVGLAPLDPPYAPRVARPAGYRRLILVALAPLDPPDGLSYTL